VLLEALARLQMTRTLSFYTLLGNIRGSIPKDADVLIISLYMDERIEEEIRELRGRGHQVETWVISEGEEG
jgi:hypothetical protein